MAFDLFGTLSGGFGVASDLFSSLGAAKADKLTAGGYTQAAASYQQATDLTNEAADVADASQNIQEMQNERNIFKTLGGQQSDIAGAGLQNSGSALDIMRDSASQAGLSRQLLGTQGAINQLGYQKEAASYQGLKGTAEASAAAANASASTKKKSGILGAIGGAIGLATKIAPVVAAFSDDRIKENIVRVGMRDDGIGIFQYTYKGNPHVIFQGLLASDVEKVRPDAVSRTDAGFLMVDYGLLGETIKEVK